MYVIPIRLIMLMTMLLFCIFIMLSMILFVSLVLLLPVITRASLT